MSENITHTAVVDDCARLALHAPDICAAFKAALANHLDIARLGGVTRSGDDFTVDLLRTFRSRTNDAEGTSQKLAFVLGWLSHRAADRQMKPIWRSMPDETKSPTDCSIYHDVFLLREVYGGGRQGPYCSATAEEPIRSLEAAECMDAAAVEDLFRAFGIRTLLAIHTFIPDGEDIEGWIERLIGVRQRVRVDIARYARAFAKPEPDKVRRYIDEVGFYDASETLIRLARSIQRGAPDGTIDLDSALESAADGSQYAQALRKAFLYLRAASRFYLGRMPEEEVRDRLDIHKPGG